MKDEKNRWVYKVAYTWSTVVKAAGTKVAYDHEAYLWKDKVEIPGPTKQVLKLMVRRHQLQVLYIYKEKKTARGYRNNKN